MRDEIPYAEIVARLNDMAETIAADMMPDGRRDGQYWRGDCHGKCSVHIKGGRVGLVGFWQGQRTEASGGNLIHLIEIAMGFGTHGEAVRFAKERYLGLGRRELTAEEKRKWAQAQDAAKQKAARREAEQQAQRERKVETVRSIWHEAVALKGTIAEAYLVSRGLGMPEYPASLRFHPSLKLGDESHPALIGGVQAADRKLVAVWRIFLRPDGSALTDAEGKKVKLGLGPASGGAVRLAPAGPVLRVTEGIETGLGVHLLTKGTAPVWAMLSTSGMIGFEIPEGVRRIEIYADGDRHRMNKRTGAVDKPPGIVAAEKFKARAANEGVEAVIYASPEPDDWLNVWQSLKRDQEQARAVQYGE